MSIIYNALKKTEEENPDKASDSKEKASPKGPQVPKKAKKKVPVVKIVALLIMFSCMGALVYFITSQGQTSIKGPSVKLSFDLKSIFKGSKKQKSSSGYVFNAAKYQINGILTSDTKNIAMINGQSYATGAFIDDLTIKEISETKVVFIAPSKEEFTIDIE